jgi:hypothetical protein
MDTLAQIEVEAAIAEFYRVNNKMPTLLIMDYISFLALARCKYVYSSDGTVKRYYNDIEVDTPFYGGKIIKAMFKFKN